MDGAPPHPPLARKAAVTELVFEESTLDDGTRVLAFGGDLDLANDEAFLLAVEDYLYSCRILH